MAPHPARKDSQPYRAGVVQPWAADTLDKAHEEALYSYGEMCLYTLMWRMIDHERGLVERCSTCFGGSYSRQAAAFKQPTNRECPDCFGTTFDGGYRAQIIRPTLFADRNSELSEESRGYVTSDTLQVETTSDFTLHKGDYLFRFDNTRFQLEAKRDPVLRTGFVPPTMADSFGGTVTAHLEETTTTAFRIPPASPEELQDLLGLPGPFFVEDITATDVVKPGGYLV